MGTRKRRKQEVHCTLEIESQTARYQIENKTASNNNLPTGTPLSQEKSRRVFPRRCRMCIDEPSSSTTCLKENSNTTQQYLATEKTDNTKELSSFKVVYMVQQNQSVSHTSKSSDNVEPWDVVKTEVDSDRYIHTGKLASDMAQSNSSLSPTEKASLNKEDKRFRRNSSSSCELYELIDELQNQGFIAVETSSFVAKIPTNNITQDSEDSDFNEENTSGSMYYSPTRLDYLCEVARKSRKQEIKDNDVARVCADESEVPLPDDLKDVSISLNTDLLHVELVELLDMYDINSTDNFDNLNV